MVPPSIPPSEVQHKYPTIVFDANRLNDVSNSFSQHYE